MQNLYVRYFTIPGVYNILHLRYLTIVQKFEKKTI